MAKPALSWSLLPGKRRDRLCRHVSSTWLTIEQDATWPITRSQIADREFIKRPRHRSVLGIILCQQSSSACPVNM